MSYLDVLVSHAHAQLDDEARDYLNGRGVSDEQIDAFGIGVLRGSIPTLPLLGAGPFLEWVKEGAPIDNALVFPLTNAIGEVRGVQFRALDREQKGYSDFFHDDGAGEYVTFGLGQAVEAMWKEQAVWLVEGVFDHLPIQRHYPALLPVLSVRVTPALVRLLRRLVKTVYVGYDMDRTGRAAAERFRREHERDVDVRVVSYPAVRRFGAAKNVKDPGELWEAWGDGPLGAFVRQTVKGAFDGEDLQ